MTDDPLVPSTARAVELGVITVAPAAADIDGWENAARHVEGILVPEDVPFAARVGQINGHFFYPEVGDEVIVFFPGGRDQAGVVLGTIEAVYPSTASNTKGLIIRPDGIELRSTDAGAVDNVVLSALLTDLQTFVAALETFATSLAAAGGAPGGYGAAATVLNTELALGGFGSKLVAALANSYISSKIKAEP